MKKLILGAVLLLCGSIIYGFRLLAASMLVVKDSIKGGNAGLSNGLDWVGNQSFWVALVLVVVGLLLVLAGLFENKA
ncbi:hypothetical protein SAMN02799624_03559 [Paenibacillus sp. UNC496MF]|uniref:hypothetical protein n=1 Tax=Paenibacillus sp. UNC496MF TaxID=1502753 RepID=UPI0008F0C46C|nr:hypothetical protein [Paenibacillus sp. UNC496MF]SFJ16813.1 hypothetical protein SAMN02799624_03559 [Paenibacillus sp. UNC496MF]